MGAANFYGAACRCHTASSNLTTKAPRVPAKVEFEIWWRGGVWDLNLRWGILGF